MPNVCRKGDVCSGHLAHPPRKIKTGSPNVYVNNRGVARIHDRMQFHTATVMEFAHDARLQPKYINVNGSFRLRNPTVYVNGRHVCYPKQKMEDARLLTGELIDSASSIIPPDVSICKSKILTASHNVFFENNNSEAFNE